MAEFNPAAGVKITSRPTIHNAPLPAEGQSLSRHANDETWMGRCRDCVLMLLPAGNGSFSNYHMVGAVLAVPYVLWKVLPIPYFSFTTVYTFLLLLTGLPVIVGYWMVMSHIGPRKRSNVILPGKNIEEYLDIKDPALKAQYFGQKKIPMQIFHDAYFEDKIEVKGA
jgi:hypothetical protein